MTRARPPSQRSSSRLLCSVGRSINACAERPGTQSPSVHVTVFVLQRKGMFMAGLETREGSACVGDYVLASGGSCPLRL